MAIIFPVFSTSQGGTKAEVLRPVGSNAPSLAAPNLPASRYNCGCLSLCNFRFRLAACTLTLTQFDNAQVKLVNRLGQTFGMSHTHSKMGNSPLLLHHRFCFRSQERLKGQPLSTHFDWTISSSSSEHLPAELQLYQSSYIYFDWKYW